MADKEKSSKKQIAPTNGYDAMPSGVVELLEQARRTSARAVNTIMTTTYFLLPWSHDVRLLSVDNP